MYYEGREGPVALTLLPLFLFLLRQRGEGGAEGEASWWPSRLTRPHSLHGHGRRPVGALVHGVGSPQRTVAATPSGSGVGAAARTLPFPLLFAALDKAVSLFPVALIRTALGLAAVEKKTGEQEEHTHLQGILPAETLVAEAAGEGLHGQVDALVALEVVVPVEGLGALVALEGPLLLRLLLRALAVPVALVVVRVGLRHVVRVLLVRVRRRQLDVGGGGEVRRQAEPGDAANEAYGPARVADVGHDRASHAEGVRARPQRARTAECPAQRVRPAPGGRGCRPVPWSAGGCAGEASGAKAEKDDGAADVDTCRPGETARYSPMDVVAAVAGGRACCWCCWC